MILLSVLHSFALVLVGAALGVLFAHVLRLLVLLVPWPEWASIASIPALAFFHFFRGALAAAWGVMLGSVVCGRVAADAASALRAVIVPLAVAAVVVLLVAFFAGALSRTDTVMLAIEALSAIYGASYGRSQMLQIVSRRLSTPAPATT